MKRFFHHFFTFFAALSLLLCIVVCANWVESYADRWARVGRSMVTLEHERGWVEISVYRSIPDERGRIGPPPNLPAPRGWDLGPLAVRWGVTQHPMSAGIWRSAEFTCVQVSHWLLAALLAAPPCIWALRRRRLSRRRLAGCCLTCGYDLRAHREGGAGERCPECGTPAPAPAPAPTSPASRTSPASAKGAA